MSNINGLGQAQSLARIQAAKAAAPSTPATSAEKPSRADKVEVNSTVSAFLSKLKGNDVRLDKVQGIKSQIEAGTYDADSKLDDASLDKLLDDLA